MVHVFVDTVASRVIGIAVNDNKTDEPLGNIALFDRFGIFIFNAGRKRNDRGNGFRNGVDAQSRAVILFINFLSGGISVDVLQTGQKTAEILRGIPAFQKLFDHFLIHRRGAVQAENLEIFVTGVFQILINSFKSIFDLFFTVIR